MFKGSKHVDPVQPRHFDGMRWVVWSAVGIFAVYRLFLAPNLLTADSFNGFDVSNSEIPVERIEHGGPPRDGIPAIDQPRFVAAVEARFLHPGDWVVGLDLQGRQRAYPVKILNYHEIVNDRIGGEGVFISYCPLCRTAMAFHSDVGGEARSFGVSGLLYNSDVLMYDRQTESLWSQILGRAIAGPSRGAALDTVPVMHTRWSDWLERYPGSEVLSPETGHRRDYNRDPYAGYENIGNLMFDVSNRDARYGNKEIVLGLETGSATRAWPFRELQRVWDANPEREYLEEQVGGDTVRIHFDPQHRSAHVTDGSGKLLNGLTAYWFAWMAFYPDSEVFSAGMPP